MTFTGRRRSSSQIGRRWVVYRCHGCGIRLHADTSGQDELASGPRPSRTWRLEDLVHLVAIHLLIDDGLPIPRSSHGDVRLAAAHVPMQPACE
ncbi:MAG: hypothetical protein MZV70_18715 [Desulfobacterales bacterium]|nr:hypothetical protein [Desulfobacterales bacterium]